MDLDDAIRMAEQQYFLGITKSLERLHEVSVQRNLCRKSPIGWVLYYQSTKYLETRDLNDALSGNLPLIVDERDMTVRTLPKEKSLEAALAAYLKLHP